MQVPSKQVDTFRYRHDTHAYKMAEHEQQSVNDVVQHRDAGLSSPLMSTIREIEPSESGNLNPAHGGLLPHSPLSAPPPSSSFNVSGYGPSGLNFEDPSKNDSATVFIQRSPFSLDKGGGRAHCSHQQQVAFPSSPIGLQNAPVLSHSMKGSRDGPGHVQEVGLISRSNTLMSAWGSGGGSFTEPVTADRNNSFRVAAEASMVRQDAVMNVRSAHHDHPVSKPGVTSAGASTFVKRALAGSQTEVVGHGNAMVRMSRSEAWSKFLAYEGCIQVRAASK
jgi:hypothetical protein